MIIATGKHISIETPWGITISRRAETPGAVTIMDREGSRVTLPANPEGAQRFIEAYQRAIAEDLAYRTVEVT